ncbi:recombinase RecT [Selenomonas artemidis]|uniref:recombinase RecT n=1 Tax=Selenomonas artemidis TaxID=671224 RepID=UPI000418E28B|nr:recombinase RecT [Selenomonas artemidis]
MANVNGGAIQKAQTEKSAAVKTQRSMKDLIISMEGQIAKALPSVITPERFTRMVLTAMSTNKDLQLCTPNSFLGAMMQAAQLGVEPNTPLGQAYLIPYKNKGTLECSFQLGYKGLIDLAYRSGEVKDIQAHEVHENDTFEYELGLEPKLKHIPAMKNRGAVIMYYAIFHTKDGGYGFNVMSVDDVQEHARKYSKPYGSSFSPWKSNFDEMAKKTVLKRCLKYAPIKTEFARSISTDETIKTTIAADMAEQADETDYIDAEVVEKDAPEVIEEKGRTVDAATGEVLELEAEEQA